MLKVNKKFKSLKQLSFKVCKSLQVSRVYTQSGIKNKKFISQLDTLTRATFEVVF